MIITDRLTEREITKQGGGYLSGAGSISASRGIDITGGIAIPAGESIMVLVRHANGAPTTTFRLRTSNFISAYPALSGWNGQELTGQWHLPTPGVQISHLFTMADTSQFARQIDGAWHFFMVIQATSAITITDIDIWNTQGVPATAADWVIVRPIRHRFPPLAFSSVRFARQKRETKSITGKSFITNLSPQKILSFNVKLKAEPDDSIAQGIATLDDDTDGFGVFPMGDSLALAQQEAVEYRQFGVCRNMLMSNWTGWMGNQGIDTLGATGTATFKETV